MDVKMDDQPLIEFRQIHRYQNVVDMDEESVMHKDWTGFTIILIGAVNGSCAQFSLASDQMFIHSVF